MGETISSWLTRGLPEEQLEKEREEAITKAMAELKTEAIRTFAKRLKAEFGKIPLWGAVAVRKVENLEKEMTGDADD